MQSGYKISALEPYFPNLQQHLRSNVGFNAALGGRDEIDEATLNQFIQQVSISRHYSETNLFKNLVNTADPVWGTRAIYNVVTGYQLNNGFDYINAALSVLNMVPVLKATGTAGARGIITGFNYAKAARDMRAIRHTVATEGHVPSQVIDGRIRTRMEELEHGDALWGSLKKDFEANPGILPKSGLRKITSFEAAYLSHLTSLIQSGKAFVVKRDITQDLLSKATNKMRENNKLSRIIPSASVVFSN